MWWSWWWWCCTRGDWAVFSHHISRWKFAPATSPNSLKQRQWRVIQISIWFTWSNNVDSDSQYEGLVPDGVQGLFLYFCLVDLVTGCCIFHNWFTGFGSGLASPLLLLILQYGQKTVWVTETCSHTPELTWHGDNSTGGWNKDYRLHITEVEVKLTVSIKLMKHMDYH